MKMGDLHFVNFGDGVVNTIDITADRIIIHRLVVLMNEQTIVRGSEVTGIYF